MKKILSVFLLVAVGSMAVASEAARDIRLQLVVSPLIHGTTAPTRVDYTITVYDDGEVEGFRCVGGSATSPCFQTTIQQLTSSERDTIEAEIAQARTGHIVPPNPFGMHCMAMPVRAVHYSADNDRVLLESGAVPCGNVTRNDSPAASELIRLLNQFDRQFQSETR